MKKILYIIIGVLLLGLAVVENHSCTEQQKAKNKTQLLIAVDLAERKAENNGWTSEQKDSCIASERDRLIYTPCVYCSIIEPLIR